MFVSTQQLTKTYRTLCALSQCTLGVNQGEVFGLLGPNGAGKTTLLRLLMGFLRPTSGTAKIDGLDCYSQPVAVHTRVTYLPGDVRLFRTMRGRGVLEFFAHVRPGGNFQRALEVARRLDLDVSRLVAYMSTGMRQKLALAASLSAETPLVILDEPTSNLDPTVRSEVAALVREAKAAGRTIVFSSHVLSEVEDVCDRVAILRAGSLVHTQCLKELRRRHRIHADLAGDMPAPPAAVSGELMLKRVAGGGVIIETPGELSPLLSWLATLPVKEMRIEPLGLRAVYDQYHVA